MFIVRYEGQQIDRSRVDARQVRLRVFRDDSYFQFFTGIVAGWDLVLRGLDVDDAKARLWRAVANECVGDIKEAISRRAVPLDDPTKAYEVFPDIDRAARRARECEPIREDDVVATFVESEVGIG